LNSASLTTSKGSSVSKLPTVNIKFEKFLVVIFKSKMSPEDVRDQIVKYVQAIETNYMEAINDLKECLVREK